MPNIRIKDIPTTASATSSTDFIGIDGSANGTRKLNAFSPTFGGNLTVSGTGTSSFQSTTPPTVQIANTTSGLADTQTAANNVVIGTLKFGHPSDAQSDKFPSIVGRFDPTDASFARSTQLEFYTSTPAGNALGMTLNKTGNLTVSGGTITGGTSGMSLASGGTNQNITLTPSGTGLVRVTCSRATAYSSSLTGDVVIYNPDQTDNGYSSLAFGTRTSAGGVVDTGSAIASITTSHVGASFATQLAFLTRNGSGTLVEAGRFTNGGNLILKSDGVDSANGKLQLAAHSTSAGGIGLGTTAVIYNNGSSGIIFGTNGSTTALTLDSSQNATFAGTVTFGKGAGNTTFSANGTTAESGIFTQANTGFVFFSDNATATKGIKVDVNNGGLTVLSGGLTTATAGGSAGTWKLGVYSATAPSATGYVTIDIGGTIYKLLAST